MRAPRCPGNRGVVGFSGRQDRSGKVWLAGLALLLGLCGVGASSSTALEDASDARLTRTVKLEQVGGSVGEYVNRLAEATGVAHQAESPFDERALLALGVNHSLRALQAVIAENYRLTWRASQEEPPAYTLHESEADRKARGSARNSLRLRARAQMQARWEEVNRMAFLSPEELARRRAAGDAKGGSLLDRQTSANARLVAQLPEAVIRQFWTRGSATMRIADLPMELQDLAVAGAPQVRGLDRATVVDEGILHLRVGGTMDRPTVWLCTNYGRHGNVYNALYSEGWTRQPAEERRRQSTPSKVPTDRRFRQKVTLRDPAIRTGGLPGERPSGAKPLAELLEELAGQTELPILAECEYVPKKKPKRPEWLQEQWWLAAEIEEKPLWHALDLLCADFEFEWRFKTGTILLRPRLWFAEPKQREYVIPSSR